MVLWEECVKDENNLKLTWDLAWVKHLKYNLVVAGQGHS
jgi:hypothetical protein